MEIVENTLPVPLSDFLARPLFAHLATVGTAGSARNTPVWYLWEDASLWVIPNAGDRTIDDRIRADDRIGAGIVDFELASGLVQHVGMRGTGELVEHDPDRGPVRCRDGGDRTFRIPAGEGPAMITADRMAAVDRNATALGVSQRQLMESAGGAVARAVRGAADPGASVAVVGGRGNNGGDAFVAARFLSEYAVTVHLLGRAETITTDAARANWDALVEADCDTREVVDSADLDLGDPDVIVDGLLGTGISGTPRAPERTAVAAVNDADATVVSVDVPSGLDADTGEAALAVDADRVVTFHDLKPGLDGRDDVTVADLGIPAAAERFVGPGDLLPIQRGSRPENDTRVFVVGGGPYTGAPALSAQAALRAGASLSFVAVPETVSTPIQSYAEDLIVQPYESDRLTPEHVPDLVDTATRYDDVVVLGPGLGNADETLEAARQFLDDFDGPAVVDADALAVLGEVDTDATVVCTPNAKELAALGGPEADEPAEHADEIEALAGDLGHVIVAKGAVDVITDGETTRRCRAGDPGMAVGGTGDVLSGVVAAFLGAAAPLEAATAAPYANGRAGERLAADLGDGFLASDLLEALPPVLEDP